MKPQDQRERTTDLSAKRHTGLTDEERRILLADLAEIAAELDALQERTAEIAARVAPHPSIRLARPA